MSGSSNTPSTAEIQEATRAFIVDDAISESQLESIRAGQTTLEQARQSGSEPDPSPSGGGSSGGDSGGGPSGGLSGGLVEVDEGAANESVVESAGAPGLREMGIDPEDGL